MGSSGTYKKVLLKLRGGRVTTSTTLRRRLVTGGAVVRRAYLMCDGLCPRIYKEALKLEEGERAVCLQTSTTWKRRGLYSREKERVIDGSGDNRGCPHQATTHE